MLRAMVLGKDADRLIVGATPGEVDQFGKGQEVTVAKGYDDLKRDILYDLVNQGWELKRAAQDAHLSFQPGARPNVAVLTLRTRCGCTRRELTQYPPPDIYRVPIINNTHVPMGEFFIDMESQQVTVREFRLYQRTGDDSFEYREA
jgi:hypothetical protein